MKRRWDEYHPCDICLINPPWVTKEDNIWHGIKAAMPPLGLLSVAAYLEEREQNVAVIDAHVEKLSVVQLKDRIRQLKPKIIGITVMTSTSYNANKIARLAKEVDPSIVVIMGGVHAEVLPEECLRNKNVDIVVRGDGENTFYLLCSAILKGEPYNALPGISFRDSKNGKARVVNNLSAEPIKDLNILPMFSYHIVPMHRYYPSIGAYRNLPAINMLMTRGCPGRCSFCNSAKSTLRTRDAALVVDEIIYLKKRYGIKEIQFYDDTFTVMRENVFKFCRLMVEKKAKITWSAFARVDCIDQKMATQMRKAGCHQILLGIESGDDEVLRKIGKPISLQKAREAVKLIRKAGIEARCAFVYGCEGETEESMRKTLDFSISIGCDLAIFNIATPYPGTMLFKWAKEGGYLISEEWSDYELGHPIIKLPSVSPEKVSEYYDKSFKVFYRRPKLLLGRLKRATSLYHWRDIIVAFFYIMLRCKLGVRGEAKREWEMCKKADFFDYSFDAF